jgi:chlorobactene glucosyltransferase
MGMLNPIIFQDIFFYFFAFLICVWIYRAYRALHTLRLLPIIKNSDDVKTTSNKVKITFFVPAKNEEFNIKDCIESLLNQNYEDFEIIVINDNSTDNTENILKKMGALYLTNPEAENPKNRLKYFNNSPTPPEWTGKNFALHSAVPHAKGDWFIFTDADTKHAPDCVRSCLTHIKKHSLNFLTLIPNCLTSGFWEELVQPTAMCLLGLWFPLEKVNDPHSKIHFANGQFLMMSKNTYQAIGGHKGVKDEFLEDFALMKKAKKLGVKVQVASGKDIFGTRMYSSLNSIRKGWRRIYLHAFKKNTLHLYLATLSLFCFSLLPFLSLPLVITRAILWPELYTPTLFVALIAILMMILITAKSYSFVKGNIWLAFLHPLATFCVIIILADACGMSLVGKKTKWR